jgi:uncharacterized protein (DUF4415 family)
MEIEFDPKKDAANIAKNGSSLARAVAFQVRTYERVAEHGEVRIWAIGTLDDVYHSLTFVFRRNAIRVISLRRAHHKEVDRMVRKTAGLKEDGAPFEYERDGIVFDEDNPEWTEERLAHARPASELPDEILAFFPNTRVRGPQKSPTKVAVSLRLSSDVIEHFKSGGPGWQTRIDEALREVVKKAS